MLFKNPNDYAKIIHGMRVIEEETGEKPLLRYTINKERYIISGNVRMWRDFIKKCISKNIYICNKALKLLTYVFDITSKTEFKTLFGDILSIPSEYEINPYPVTFLAADDLITDTEILTHKTITIKFITDRGISHEIVRHRLASYSQESTRYVNYKNKGIEFICPSQIEERSEEYLIWKNSVNSINLAYNSLLRTKKPQIARAVLPTCLKTEIVETATVREWLHEINLRVDKASHPDIRKLMIPLLQGFILEMPTIFSSIQVKE